MNDKKNVLPNSYIPVLTKGVLGNVLGRLPKQSLIEFMGVWPKVPSAYPQLTKELGSQKELNRQVTAEARRIKLNGAKYSKRKILDKILYQYWSKGLTLLQLSQIDCQLIVDRPNSFYWVRSTVKDSHNKEVPILLDPKLFLNRLATHLSTLYYNYIYVCRHPRYPLIIIRIQVFDLNLISSGTSQRPHISSNRAFFLAIPLNSPHIIHSAGNDMIANIVLQVVQISLPQTPNNLVNLSTPKGEAPVRSLESMHILHGNSRFGNSLGVWTPYADGTVDLLPFNAVENHPSIQPAADDKENDDVDDMTRLKQVANLRFKGSRSGVLKSKVLYDNNRPTRRSHRIIDNGDDDDNEDEQEKSEFASIAPIQYSDITIKEKINPHDKDLSSINIKLIGPDVFAGLHELSVLTTDPAKMVVNPETIPGYLTGEEGITCGVVQNSKFSKHEYNNEAQ